MTYRDEEPFSPRSPVDFWWSGVGGLFRLFR
jgi:hypothetical protein